MVGNVKGASVPDYKKGEDVCLDSAPQKLSDYFFPSPGSPDQKVLRAKN